MDNFAASCSGVVAARSPLRSQLDGFLRHLTRIPASASYIPEIDGQRFLAIGSVVLIHLSFFKPWFTAGQLGVQLFFIISGFVFALPFARHAISDGRQVSVRNYFFRRLTRLAPPNLISLPPMYELRRRFAKARCNCSAPRSLNFQRESERFARTAWNDR